MSEFDKEAERERLREKFAKEEAERESARHMSELLLQGATMTDRHCPACGTPLFRDDGETFCPECERAVIAADEAPATPPEEPEPATSEPAIDIDADSTRASLEAALQRAAAAAAAADDPRDAKEHLEAAQAAIEALNALDDGA